MATTTAARAAVRSFRPTRFHCESAQRRAMRAARALRAALDAGTLNLDTGEAQAAEGLLRALVREARQAAREARAFRLDAPAEAARRLAREAADARLVAQLRALEPAPFVPRRSPTEQLERTLTRVLATPAGV